MAGTFIVCRHSERYKALVFIYMFAIVIAVVYCTSKVVRSCTFQNQLCYNVYTRWPTVIVTLWKVCTQCANFCGCGPTFQKMLKNICSPVHQ